MPYVVRIGHRVTTPDDAPVVLPIEGARTILDRDDVAGDPRSNTLLRVLIALEDPTEAERRAVEHRPVELGVLAAPTPALLLRIAADDAHDRIETLAPLDLRTADPHAFLLEHGRPAPLHITLCDGENGRVVATRSLEAPAHVADALRSAARPRSATVAELMTRAVARAVVV